MLADATGTQNEYADSTQLSPTLIERYRASAIYTSKSGLDDFPRPNCHNTNQLVIEYIKHWELGFSQHPEPIMNPLRKPGWLELTESALEELRCYLSLYTTLDDDPRPDEVGVRELWPVYEDGSPRMLEDKASMIYIRSCGNYSSYTVEVIGDSDGNWSFIRRIKGEEKVATLFKTRSLKSLFRFMRRKGDTFKGLYLDYDYTSNDPAALKQANKPESFGAFS